MMAHLQKLSVSLVLVLATASLARAQQSTLLEPPQIIASGEGLVTATPDRAWVSVGAESRAKTSRDAQQQNATIMTAVQQKVASLGVPKDAIRTTAIDLQPEFDFANGKQTLRGYVARNTIEIRADDTSKIGELLDAVTASGAATIHGLRFDVKARAELERAALQQAVKDASAKAQAIASGLGRAIDRVLRVEEQFTGNQFPEPMMRSLAMEKTAATPVAPGEIEIRAQVRLTASIK
jgi:uncharacterized protein YggE